MSTPQLKEYPVLSLGQWDQDAAKAEIEVSIAKCYEWYERNVQSGQFKPGSRLGTDMATVSKAGKNDFKDYASLRQGGGKKATK